MKNPISLGVNLNPARVGHTKSSTTWEEKNPNPKRLRPKNCVIRQIFIKQEWSRRSPDLSPHLRSTDQMERLYCSQSLCRAARLDLCNTLQHKNLPPKVLQIHFRLCDLLHPRGLIILGTEQNVL